MSGRCNLSFAGRSCGGCFLGVVGGRGVGLGGGL